MQQDLGKTMIHKLKVNPKVQCVRKYMSILSRFLMPWSTPCVSPMPFTIVEKMMISALAILLLMPVIGHAAEMGSLSDRVSRIERMVDTRQDVDVMLQIQEMQQEIQSLRGQVEEAAALIMQLQEQQRNAYRDLDRRLETSARPVAHATPAVSPKPITMAPAVIQSKEPLMVSNDETNLYRQAYQEVVAKNYQVASKQFLEYIAKYPQGQHLPNAYYWLGEIYLLNHNAAEAAQAFQNVLGFSNHHKVGDALLKMGYAYDEQGNTVKAKEVYLDVSQRFKGTALARLADGRLAKLRQGQ